MVVLDVVIVEAVATVVVATGKFLLHHFGFLGALHHHAFLHIFHPIVCLFSSFVVVAEAVDVEERRVVTKKSGFPAQNLDVWSRMAKSNLSKRFFCFRYLSRNTKLLIT